MNMIAHHEVPLGNVTPLARDILHYGLINEAFKRVLDAQMNYNGKHYVSIDNPETGKQEWVSNPDYVPLDSIRANRLFVRYERMMLNTPLVLCSPQSWLEI